MERERMVQALVNFPQETVIVTLFQEAKCSVAPLMMGHPTTVSGAMPLLSLHLVCLFGFGLGSGEG